MSTSAHGCPPRDASVMTNSATPDPLSLNHAPRSRIGGYEIVSSTVADLSRFRVHDYSGTAHCEQESPRGDASVMTRTAPSERSA